MTKDAGVKHRDKVREGLSRCKELLNNWATTATAEVVRESGEEYLVRHWTKKKKKKRLMKCENEQRV